MTYKEFLSRLPEGARKPSIGEYNIISLVYCWHPSISRDEREGQVQIVRLYCEFGMHIIKDMLDSAQMAKLEKKLANAKAEVKRIESEIEKLSTTKK